MGRVNTFAAVGLLAAAATAFPLAPPVVSSKRAENTTKAFATFDDVVPSPELNWTDCYGEKLQCAFLTVPLDYANPSAGTADVAFMKYVFAEDAEELLYNPGGPGEGGTGFVPSNGPNAGKKWGYNYVSFDPRGTGRSGPKISCSPSTGNSTTNALKRRKDEGALGDLREFFDSNLQINKACSEANKDTDAKYVGTSAVVQDMMHFVELSAAARGENPEEAKINYWGTSYGTVVGQTLVAMYPDRIKRVLLDGNVYGVAFYQGWYPTSIDDLAHAIWMFSKFCFESGPEWCALSEGMNSIDDVQARFDGALSKLDAEPIEVEGGLLERNTFTNLVQSYLYNPRNPGKGYANVVNITLFVETGDKSFIEVPGSEEPPAAAEGQDALMIITSVDIAGRYPWNTYEEWKAATERLQETAPYNAKSYAVTNGLIGLAMDSFVPPPSQFFPGFEFVNTSAPVLFVNTAGDPVTPRSAVHQMARLFGGSSWFIHNSPGHGFQNAPSKCTDDILAAYFADGVVPEPETWCEPDVDANFYFGGPDPSKTATK